MLIITNETTENQSKAKSSKATWTPTTNPMNEKRKQQTEKSSHIFEMPINLHQRRIHAVCCCSCCWIFFHCFRLCELLLLAFSSPLFFSILHVTVACPFCFYGYFCFSCCHCWLRVCMCMCDFYVLGVRLVIVGGVFTLFHFEFQFDAIIKMLSFVYTWLLLVW